MLLFFCYCFLLLFVVVVTVCFPRCLIVCCCLLGVDCLIDADHLLVVLATTVAGYYLLLVC